MANKPLNFHKPLSIGPSRTLRLQEFCIVQFPMKHSSTILFQQFSLDRTTSYLLAGITKNKIFLYLQLGSNYNKWFQAPFKTLKTCILTIILYLITIYPTVIQFQVIYWRPVLQGRWNRIPSQVSMLLLKALNTETP